MAGKLHGLGSCVLILLTFLFVSMRCGEEETPEFVTMSFIVPMSVQPAEPEFQKGDTLWFSAVFPDTLLEYYSNKYYKLSAFDFRTSVAVFSISFPELYIGQQPGAINSFKILNMTGGLSEPSESFAKLSIEYSGSNYSFLFRLIPQSTGIFSVTMVWYNNDSPACSSFGDCIDLTKQINLGSTEDGRKRVPVYEAIFYVINDGNVNFDLLSANCKAGSLETPNSATAVFAEQKGTYTFRVVE